MYINGETREKDRAVFKNSIYFQGGGYVLRDNTNNPLCSRPHGPGALIFPSKARIPCSKVSRPHKCIGGPGVMVH